MRPSNTDYSKTQKRPPHSNVGTTPFGFSRLRDKLVVDAKEIETLRLILKLWQSGKIFHSIAVHLNRYNINPRKGKAWQYASVKSIIQHHKTRLVGVLACSGNIEDGQSGIAINVSYMEAVSAILPVGGAIGRVWGATVENIHSIGNLFVFGTLANGMLGAFNTGGQLAIRSDRPSLKFPLPVMCFMTQPRSKLTQP
jgi:hypothetical protein